MMKSLGHRIRKLRKEKGLTLVEIAEKTGVAQATLSRIETGSMTGTVESHEKIAEILGIGLAELYTGVDARYENIAHLKESERKVTQHTQDVQVELLTAEISKKKITPVLLTLQPASKTTPESCERGVEKFLYVLQGKIQAKVSNDVFSLSTGETLYFDASLDHFFSNQHTGTSKALIAVSPSKL